MLVLKDGEIVAERKPEQRMLSNSMAKTIVALAFGKALEEGRIRSLDDRAADYGPRLAGSLYGDTNLGYGLQTWLLPGSTRRFALLGVYGQAIMVDPALKLVVVHMAAAKDASGDASGAHMGAERNALWHGIVARYGRW